MPINEAFSNNIVIPSLMSVQTESGAYPFCEEIFLFGMKIHLGSQSVLPLYLVNVTMTLTF